VRLRDFGNEDQYGECDDLRNTIDVSVLCEPASRRVELFFHELLHAFLSQAGVDQEEMLVTMLAERLVAFLVDNPKFMGELLQELEEAKHGEGVDG
jgi:hypothetical protein